MDKKQYERLKAIKARVANGTATFTERTIIRMEEKKRRKREAQEQERRNQVQPQTGSTKRLQH